MLKVIITAEHTLVIRKTSTGVRIQRRFLSPTKSFQPVADQPVLLCWEVKQDVS